MTKSELDKFGDPVNQGDRFFEGQDETDRINEDLENLIAKICDILEHKADHVRPFEAAQVVRAFVPAINLATNLDPDFLKEELTNLGGLTHEAISELFLAMPIMWRDGHFDELDQHLAVDVARVLGPDHAQNWYRFAVLVTKLA